MTVRSRAFWAMDRIRGGSLQAQLRDVRSHMTNADPARTQALLHSQLTHATTNVPYYRDLRNFGQLSEFPVVDKSVIIDSFDSTIATNYDTSAAHVASTSGSTGTPFKVFHDAHKRERVLAEAIYWGSLAGYELGLPLIHLKVWSDRNRIGFLPRVLRNIVPVDSTKLKGEELIEKLTNAGRSGPVSLISYSSTLSILARSLDQQANRGEALTQLPRVASIIGQSEALPFEARAALRRYLGVDPVGRYGLEELGIVAQQERDGDGRYLVNRASQFVEILELDGVNPVEPGQIGRIVVTELFNRVQPLIRYDTGDLGSFSLDRSGEVDERFLSVIEGRKLDQIFDVDDEPLTSMVMYNVWWRFPEIRQYQLVQRGKGNYLLRLNVSPTFNNESEVVRHFKTIVGKAATVDIERTIDDFVLSSGKRKSVVSHYRPAS